MKQHGVLIVILLITTVVQISKAQLTAQQTCGASNCTTSTVIKCTSVQLTVPNLLNFIRCLQTLTTICNKPVVMLGDVLRGLLVFLSCVLAVVLNILSGFLKQNLGGLGALLGNLVQKLEEGLDALVAQLGVGLDAALG